MIFTVGPFSFRTIYNDHYGDRSTKTKGGKSKWVDKERQRPNCAILDKRYEVLPFCVYLYFLRKDGSVWSLE